MGKEKVCSEGSLMVIALKTGILRFLCLVCGETETCSGEDRMISCSFVRSGRMECYRPLLLKGYVFYADVRGLCFRCGCRMVGRGVVDSLGREVEGVSCFGCYSC